MKQIFLYTSLALMALAVTTTGAAPEPCYGTVQLTSQSNFQVRQAGRQTFVQFDFTGLHDICLADGSVVTGIVAGHLAQRTSANIAAPVATALWAVIDYLERYEHPVSRGR